MDQRAAGALAGIALVLGIAVGHLWTDFSRDCYCGETRTCPFGPGIVGKQHCTSGNNWSRCEPNRDSNSQRNR